MALRAPSNLSLDITISGDSPKIARETAVEIQKAEANTERLNKRLREQIAYMRELRSFTINKQDVIGVRDADINKYKQAISALKADQQARIGLTQAAREENAESLKKLKTLQQHEAQNKKTAESTNILGQAWNKFSMIFTRVLDALVAFKIIQWISQAFELFTTHAIEVNEQFEKLQMRLYNLNPDLQQTARIWQEIKKVTVTSPFRITEIGQGAVMLRTFGVDAVANLRVVSDWAAATEKSLEDVATAFGKISNRSPRTGLLLSTRGLSAGAYELYVEEYKDRALALNAYINDVFGGTSAKISETFYGLKTNIADLFDILIQGKSESVFTKLKDDLSYIQAILKDLSVGSHGQGIYGIVANLIPDDMLKIASTPSLIHELNQLMSLRTNVSSGKALYAPLENTKEELARLERIERIENLIVEHSGENNKWLQERIKNQRVLVGLANEELAIKNSRISRAEAFDIQKNLSPENLKWLQQFGTKFTGNDWLSKANTNLLTTASTVVTQQARMVQIRKDIQALFIDENTGKPVGPSENEAKDRWAVRRQQDLIEFLKELAETSKTSTKSLKDLLSVLNELFAKVAGQKARLSELLFGEKPLSAKIAENTAYLNEKGIDLTRRMSYVNEAQNDLNKLKGLTNEQLNDPKNEAEVTRLKQVAENIDKIIQLTQDENTQKQKLIQSQEKYNNLVEKNFLKQQQIARNKIDNAYGVGDISASSYRTELQRRITELQNKSKYYGLMSGIEATGANVHDELYGKDSEYYDKLKESQEFKTKQLEVEQEIYEIERKILSLPAQTFGDALNKQLLLAKKTLDSIHDELATMTLDAVRELGKGLITEVLFGTKEKELTSQIDDLRFQLIEIQAEKQNSLDTATKVKLVEDQEISLLYRINELERERSSIILSLLRDISSKMVDKLEDLAINALFSLAGGLFSGGGNTGGSGFNDYNIPTNSNPMGNVLLPETGGTSKTNIIQFNGNVYGSREFKEEVKTAIVEINRNVR